MRRRYDCKVIRDGGVIRDGEFTASLDLDDERESDVELYGLLAAAVVGDRGRVEDIAEYVMEVVREGGGRPELVYRTAYRRDLS